MPSRSRSGALAMLMTAVLGVTAMTACQAPGRDGRDGGGRYGFGVSANPGVSLQEDVVVITGGSDSILAASADGLTWTLDDDAPGMRDLEPGKIMFASGMAVGRVVGMRPVAGGTEVTLLPAALTDIIRDGNLTFTEEIAPEDLLSQNVPGLEPVSVELSTATPPTSISPPSRSGGFRRLGSRVHHVARMADDGGLPEPVRNETIKFTVGNNEVQPFHKGDAYGVRVQNKQSERKDGGYKVGLKIGFDAYVKLADKVTVSSDLQFHDGALLKGAKFYIDGIKGFGLEAYAGAPNGSRDNFKLRLEVPVELTKQLVIEGIPMLFQLKTKVFVETALAGVNSTMSLAAQYEFDKRAIGMTGGAPLPVGLNIVNSLISSVQGTVLAPSGLVLGFEAKFFIGPGIAALAVGAYAKFQFGVGVALGSALFPYFECAQATLKVGAGGGVGGLFSVADLAKVAAGLKDAVRVGAGPDQKVWGPFADSMKKATGAESGLLKDLKIELELFERMYEKEYKDFKPRDKPVCQVP